MKIQVRGKIIVREVSEEIDFPLPEETQYFFQTHIRRSIRIVPKYTTWNMENNNKPEEVYDLEITCVYLSGECKIEKFRISVRSIEEILSKEKTNREEDVIVALSKGHLDKRIEEQFISDLNYAISKITTVDPY